MYKVLVVTSSEEFEDQVNECAEEGWRLHSWQDSGGEKDFVIVIVLLKGG